MNLQSTAAQVLALAQFCDPVRVAGRVDELRRGGLPGASIPSMSRSTPRDPQLDAFDNDLTDRETDFRKGLNEALSGMRKMERAQRWVLSAMGQYVADPDPDEARKAMNKARAKATEAMLADEEQGEHRFQCDVCEQFFKRTATQRPRGGKCSACSSYALAHPEQPIPPEVLVARRVAREDKRQAC